MPAHNASPNASAELHSPEDFLEVSLENSLGNSLENSLEGFV